VSECESMSASVGVSSSMSASVILGTRAYVRV